VPQVVDEVVRPAGAELPQQAVDLAAHRPRLAGDLERRRMLLVVADEDLLERPQEIEERHLAQVDLLLLLALGGRRLLEGGLRRLSGEDAEAQPVELAEGLRHLFHPPVFEQAGDEVLARILFGLAARGRCRPWQEELRLQVDEDRRLVDVLAGDVEIQLLHEPQVLVELVADHRHRDVGDLHPVDLDEMKEEVERPLEDRQVDPPGLGERGRRFGFGRDGTAHGMTACTSLSTKRS
jgi:hypothetical protein